MDVFAKRRAGVLLHPTSLPGGCGNGDLGPEAYRFVDFLADCGVGLWQTLPLRELIDWVYDNRFVRDLTCEERALYRIQPLCDGS